jgi:general secretion pathway protein A
VVDEAQNLTSTVLEEVRLLSGIETTKEKVLRIILAGQPELNDKLDAPDLEQLAQRIRLRFHLPALSSSETRAYILHRLEVAGSQGREIFGADCFDLIYRYTGGVPRLINTLCDTALMAATDDRDVVTRDDITTVLAELQWSEYASRSGTRLMRLTPEEAAAATTGERRTADDATPAPQALARILLASGGRTVAERALAPGRLIIGRTAANDLQVESRFVSRHHCQIVTTQQSCVIEDLNSTNGIFLHSKRVRYHNLNDGDVITIGQHELLYIDERSLQRSPPDSPQPPDAET